MIQRLLESFPTEKLGYNFKDKFLCFTIFDFWNLEVVGFYSDWE